MSRSKLATIVFLMVIALPVHAQETTQSEREAMYYRYLEFSSYVKGGSIEPHWMADASSFWYAEGAPANTVIYKVDPAANTKTPLLDTVRNLSTTMGHSSGLIREQYPGLRPKASRRPAQSTCGSALSSVVTRDRGPNHGAGCTRSGRALKGTIASSMPDKMRLRSVGRQASPRKRVSGDGIACQQATLRRSSAHVERPLGSRHRGSRRQPGC
jgi:hypothetical protein